jgi:hypothetical protein
LDDAQAIFEPMACDDWASWGSILMPEYVADRKRRFEEVEREAEAARQQANIDKERRLAREKSESRRKVTAVLRAYTAGEMTLEERDRRVKELRGESTAPEAPVASSTPVPPSPTTPKAKSCPSTSSSKAPEVTPSVERASEPSEEVKDESTPKGRGKKKAEKAPRVYVKTPTEDSSKPAPKVRLHSFSFSFKLTNSFF